MAVYLFTYHTYRSWMPDNKRGYTQEGEGYQPPNPALASAYRDAAKFPPFELDGSTERFLIETAREVCDRRDWTFHAGATEPTHVHGLVSWRDGSSWEEVRGKIKNILSLELSKRSGEMGRPWFCDKASRRRVKDLEHFDYLVDVYLQTKHFGWRWSERHGWTEPAPNGRR